MLIKELLTSFTAGEARNLHWAYLYPTSYGRFLHKRKFQYSTPKHVFLAGNYPVPKEDLIIDRAPPDGSLVLNEQVVIPVGYSFKTGKVKVFCRKEPKQDNYYVNATVISSGCRKNCWVKAVYKRKFTCLLVH